MSKQFDPKILDLTALYNVAEEIINNYKEQLELDNINSSGSLSNSIEWNIAKKDENTLTLEMQLFDYWYYIEYGRNPSVGNSDWENPISDLSNWIINKIKQGTFIPRPDKQIPTTQQEIKKVANAIYDKITKYGFYGYNSEGKHSLDKTLKKSIADGLVDKFCNAVGGELANEIVVELKQIETRPIPKPKRPKN